MTTDKLDLSRLQDPFPLGDVEWRIARSGKSNQGKIWAEVLAYISARAIQDRLDQVVGVENWEVRYEFVYGKDGLTAGIICKLSIRCGPNGTWVTKEDGAEQTDVESFKGGISSALKRAGSAFGIGRYLYNLEGGWAEIVDKGTMGSRYAQTKDKEPFYWVPPQLPNWALPVSDNKKPSLLDPPPPVVPKPPVVTPPKVAPVGSTTKPGGVVTDKQRKLLWARAKALGYGDEQAKEFLKTHSGKEHSADWTRDDFERMLGAIELLETKGDAFED